MNYKASDFASAVETFVRGHAFMKSFTYPYVCQRISGLWVCGDGIGDKPRRVPRRSGITAFGFDPADVARFAKENGYQDSFISHMHSLDDVPQEIRKAYRSLGYRTMLSEEFFVHDMKDMPHFECNPAVSRVSSIADSEKIRKRRRNRKAIRDVDLTADKPEHRLYAVLSDKDAYGWVGSVPVGTDTWIADLFVRREFRGRGFGRSLMSAAMEDDKRMGIRRSVLLASGDGARLYPHLGYRHIGTLQLFCAKK